VTQTSGTAPHPGGPTAYSSQPYGTQAPPGQTHPGHGYPGHHQEHVGSVRTSGKAVTSFILGIISFILLPLIPAIIAVILGSQARKEIRNDPSQTGDGFAVAGLVLGWINIGLAALALLVFLFLFLFIAAVVGGF
jgi:hypothetical protein